VCEGHGAPDRLTGNDAALLPEAQAKLAAMESEKFGAPPSAKGEERR
jgi:hypothetical protein